MRFALQIQIDAPIGEVPLDDLRALGAAQLVRRELGTIAGIQGPEGQVVHVRDIRCRGDSQGVIALLVASAAHAADAETGLHQALRRLLQQHAVFQGWRVAVCCAETDPADSAALTGADPLTALRLDIAGGDPLARGRTRRTLLGLAPRLRAFGPEMFGVPAAGGGERRACPGELLAGSLLAGATIVLDGLLSDIRAMQWTNGTAADVVGPWVLGELPSPAARYDTGFAHRLLLVAGSGAHRLVESVWQPPTCLAEAFAVRLMFQRGYELITRHELLPDPAPLFAALVGNAFAPAHQEMFTRFAAPGAEPPGGAPLDWFGPVDRTRAVHPFAASRTG